MSVNEESRLRNLPCLKGGQCDEKASRKEKIAETFKKTEQWVLDVINSYIHNQKDPTCMKLAHDERGYSALHLAAERNFLPVAEKLLESGFNPLTPACHESKFLALHVAIRKGFDDMGALLIRHIAPCSVRQLFLNDAENTPFRDCKPRREGKTFPDETAIDDELTLNYLIKSNFCFVKTIQAVLDSLKDVNDNGLATVYVKLLEEDGNGLEPTDEGFDDHYHTVFHNLCNTEKETTNHPVIGMFVNYKWNKWGRRRFALNFLLYLVSLFSLIFSVVTAVVAADVRKYDTSLQHARVVFEIILCSLAFYRLITEIRQIKRHMLDYWKQFNNWIELLSSVIIFVVLILRYATDNAHWFVFAVAYMLWVLRIFKYAAVSSQTGAYAESLRQILTTNFVQFSLLFIVVNVAFGGVFLLVLKGEGSLDVHEETSSIFGIWFVGLRTMIEAQPIVDYTGSEGYGVAGIIVMLVFLAMTIVVLLNILIAQLSDTYSNVQSDAMKSVKRNRVAILARLERNEWQILWQILSCLLEYLCRCCCITWLLSLCKCIQWEPDKWKSFAVSNRKKYYKSHFENIDLKHQYKSYSTLLEDMDERIHELRRLQIKTDLKTQTLKSRLRQLDEKIEKNFVDLDKRMEMNFLYIKDLLELRYMSDSDIKYTSDHDKEYGSDSDMKDLSDSELKNISDAENKELSDSEIIDQSDFGIKDNYSDSEINDLPDSGVKDIFASEKNDTYSDSKVIDICEMKDKRDAEKKGNNSDDEVNDLTEC